MLPKFLFWLLFFNLAAPSASDNDFIFNGFRGSNLTLDGQAQVTPSSLLVLTNTTRYVKGHAFYNAPIIFKNSPAGEASSFSTTFVFALVPEVPRIGGNGFTFVLSPTKNFSQSLSNQFLGLFNSTNNGQKDNHILAIEFDTVSNPELNDINDNHVGIDINGLISVQAHTAGYFPNGDGEFEVLSLINGKPMKVWIEYDSKLTRLDVTITPFNMPKANKPLLSLKTNISSLLVEEMYVGFSASTGFTDQYHYITGWSFHLGSGASQPLDLANLPTPPKPPKASKSQMRVLIIWIPLVAVAVILAGVGGIGWLIARKKKFEEVLDEWELDFGPQRISYKELFRATKGFRDDMKIGEGGFGKVYRGVLPGSKVEIAVKKISHDSKQGEKEFISELASLGRLRHRNLVQLQGYCRRKRELFLVYDFMPNGSLDRYLFGATYTLGWERRFQIIKGVAAGLLYLHENNEHVVIHRDVKASNVLLDKDLNGRLGDFGMARLYDHGTDPQTTHIVGTMGYLAPELSRNGKATTATDVFAFGAFLLEVACGRRPIEGNRPPAEVELVDWVLDCWRRGEVHAATDGKLEGEYVADEVELVLKLGLLCSHPVAASRPSMRQVAQFFEGDSLVPEVFLDYWNAGGWPPIVVQGSGELVSSYPVSAVSVTSLLSEGR